MYKLAIIASTRPDFIRLARLVKLAKSSKEIECVWIATGQHYDRELFSIFLEELNIPNPDYILDIKAGTVVKQTARLFEQLEDVLLKEKPNGCLFLGDVNGVLASIVALKLNMHVLHVEAGQRSYYWNMPEERNRSIIDRISNRLYCYHSDYKINLVREGINPSNIVVVGNIIHDALDDHMAEIESRCVNIKAKYGINDKLFLCTIHRDEHVSNRDYITHVLGSIDILAGDNNAKVVLPVMPRLKEHVNTMQFKNFIMTEPLGFLDFVALEKVSSCIFTDSGTVQEEAAILGIPCVVTRECTERPQTFECGISVLEPWRIRIAFNKVMSGIYKKFSMGDGYSSQAILNDIILNHDKFSLAHDKLFDRYVGGHFA